MTRFFAACIPVFAVLWGMPLLYAQDLNGKVIDENGIAVSGVKVSFHPDTESPALIAVSDEAGRFLLMDIVPGIYELKAEKPGYYATILHSLEIAESSPLIEVVLNHQQEFEETINVVYSAPVVDRQEASKVRTLSAEEIIDLPNVATHDFHNSLPLIPGIVKDNTGRMHLNGGRENQVFYSLDGFNITSPVSGILENHVSVDALRTVTVETSRFSAEYGKGSSGVMVLESSQGDDRLRFTSTNFVPSVSLSDGLKFTNWNPRATVSGPIRKSRAWFFNALDLQYDLTLIEELPPDVNSGQSWQGSNLTRFQWNVTNKNLISLGISGNFRDTSHFGISAQDPIETSRNLDDRIYFINLKDQAYFSSGWVMETGIAVNRIHSSVQPLGRQIYVIRPEGRTGNYYLTASGRVSRQQAMASFLTPLWNGDGKHSLKFGLDIDRISYQQVSDRGSIEIRDGAGALSRRIDFFRDPHFARTSCELSGYVKDSWTVNDRLFIEGGLRFDWDQILRQRLWAPRLALTWGPKRFPDSKFSAGIGVFYDATNLRLLTRAQDQERLDTFYESPVDSGPARTFVTHFLANEQNLKAPFYLNWSVGWQQKIIQGFYIDANFMRKNGRRIWAYDLASGSATSDSFAFTYNLESARRDSYTYLEIGLSRTFMGKYPWLLSYARSNSRTTGVIDFSQDNPVFASQAAGPPDWDTPNRLISWANFPLPRWKQYTVAYFFEWHSGMPWSMVNQYQQLVGAPNVCRFPEYFSLNLHAERRIRFLHSAWALRVGFNNLTGHKNPNQVNNNIDSVDFGSYGGSPSRAFTGRIRFLGKN
jgi:hypothetical protein